jgi:NDP-sugar pyrophosphorylase family protein
MTTTDLQSYKKKHGRRRARKGATGGGLARTPVVIFAGGRGARLAPYTSILPKPLMPVGDRSILELVVDQLEMSGINDVTFCVGYLSHLIRAVFDHRVTEGVAIDYVQEQEALGTAGPLRLVDGLDETFIAMNGDVLTNLDYGSLVREHRETGNTLTVASRRRTIKIDYGVLHLGESINGNGVKHLAAWEEKPEMASYVSMGIYVLEPRALEYVPADGYFDFPSLVQALLVAGEQVGAYTYDGTWFDIGRHDDYEAAAAAWTNGTNGHAEGTTPKDEAAADEPQRETGSENGHVAPARRLRRPPSRARARSARS